MYACLFFVFYPLKSVRYNYNSLSTLEPDEIDRLSENYYRGDLAIIMIIYNLVQPLVLLYVSRHFFTDMLALFVTLFIFFQNPLNLLFFLLCVGTVFYQNRLHYTFVQIFYLFVLEASSLSFFFFYINFDFIQNYYYA